jgi:hypothetical protein
LSLDHGVQAVQQYCFHPEFGLFVTLGPDLHEIKGSVSHNSFPLQMIWFCGAATLRGTNEIELNKGRPLNRDNEFLQSPSKCEPFFTTVFDVYLI